jgi:hypothetical protein
MKMKNDNQDRWTVLDHDPERTSLKGLTPETWLCVDCGVNTAPGWPNRKQVKLDFALHGQSWFHTSDQSEVYAVKADVWALTGLPVYGGCLCIGCLEKRIGRRLKPDDFHPGHPFNSLPGTRRLLKQRRVPVRWF